MGTENEYQKPTSVLLPSEDQRVRGSQDYTFVPDQLMGKQKFEEKLNQPTFYSQALNLTKSPVIHGTETFASSIISSQGKFIKTGDSSSSPQIDGRSSYSHAKTVLNSQQDLLSGFSYENRFGSHQSPLLQGGVQMGGSLASDNHNIVSEEEDDEAKLEQKRKVSR